MYQTLEMLQIEMWIGNISIHPIVHLLLQNVHDMLIEQGHSVVRILEIKSFLLNVTNMSSVLYSWLVSHTCTHISKWEIWKALTFRATPDYKLEEKKQIAEREVRGVEVNGKTVAGREATWLTHKPDWCRAPTVKIIIANCETKMIPGLRLLS